MCVTFDVCDVCNVWCVICDLWCVSTVNNIRVGGAVALSQCLQHVPHLIQLYLSCECTIDVWIDWCVSWCDIDVWCVSHLMCDVCVICDVWVQITTLEMRERRHWVSACNTCHIWPFLTWIVSVHWCAHWLTCYLMWYTLTTQVELGKMWHVLQALTQCPRSFISNVVPCTHTSHIAHQMWHTPHINITPTNTSINPHINMHSPLR